MGKRDKRKRERTRLQQRCERKRQSPVGWFASNGYAGLCDGDALVVAGSKGAIRQFVLLAGGKWRIASTTFKEILSGMQRGAAYAFDEKAYQAFLPPAQEAGLDLTDEDFSEPGPNGVHLVRVQLSFVAPPFP